MNQAGRTFQQRLRSVSNRGNLSCANLAVWLAVPHATARSWVEKNRTPTGPRGREVFLRLALLEWAADNDPRLPVPHETLAQDRPTYVAGVRDDIIEQHRIGRIRVPVVYPAK